MFPMQTVASSLAFNGTTSGMTTATTSTAFPLSELQDLSVFEDFPDYALAPAAQEPSPLPGAAPQPLYSSGINPIWSSPYNLSGAPPMLSSLETPGGGSTAGFLIDPQPDVGAPTTEPQTGLNEDSSSSDSESEDEGQAQSSSGEDGEEAATRKGSNKRRGSLGEKPLKNGDVRRRDVFWEEMYTKLKEFKEAHGHCVVPQKYPALGGWVKRQRERKRKGKLSKDRADLLDQISFTWQIRRHGKGEADEDDSADWQPAFEGDTTSAESLNRSSEKVASTPRKAKPKQSHKEDNGSTSKKTQATTPIPTASKPHTSRKMNKTASKTKAVPCKALKGSKIAKPYCKGKGSSITTPTTLRQSTDGKPSSPTNVAQQLTAEPAAPIRNLLENEELYLKLDSDAQPVISSDPVVSPSINLQSFVPMAFSSVSEATSGLGSGILGEDPMKGFESDAFPANFYGDSDYNQLMVDFIQTPPEPLSSIATTSTTATFPSIADGRTSFSKASMPSSSIATGGTSINQPPFNPSTPSPLYATATVPSSTSLTTSPQRFQSTNTPSEGGRAGTGEGLPLQFQLDPSGGEYGLYSGELFGYLSVESSSLSSWI